MLPQQLTRWTVHFSIELVANLFDVDRPDGELSDLLAGERDVVVPLLQPGELAVFVGVDERAIVGAVLGLRLAVGDKDGVLSDQEWCVHDVRAARRSPEQVMVGEKERRASESRSSSESTRSVGSIVICFNTLQTFRLLVKIEHIQCS